MPLEVWKKEALEDMREQIENAEKKIEEAEKEVEKAERKIKKAEKEARRAEEKEWRSILALSDMLSAEVLAEKFEVPLEYILKIQQDDVSVQTKEKSDKL